MAEYHPRKRYRYNFARYPTNMSRQETPYHETDKWYFSQEEIENGSPSRKDGIEALRESHLRMCYCSFLQNLGMRLEVPQETIPCAMLLCHRFYMRQSHSKNDWQTIATVSMFLASKVNDTPCYLRDIVITAYEMIYEWDPSAPMRIRQRDIFNKQKELILVGERLFLTTIGFDLNIQLPYEPLVAALNRLNALPGLAKMAWKFIDDWIRTTLCLQYRPHVIAVASLFLSAKLEKVEIENGKEWWLEFGVPTKQLKGLSSLIFTLVFTTMLFEQLRKWSLFASFLCFFGCWLVGVNEVIRQVRAPSEKERKVVLPPMNRRVLPPPVPLGTKTMPLPPYHAFQAYQPPYYMPYGIW